MARLALSGIESPEEALFEFYKWLVFCAQNRSHSLSRILKFTRIQRSISNSENTTNMIYTTGGGSLAYPGGVCRAAGVFSNSASFLSRDEPCATPGGVCRAAGVISNSAFRSRDEPCATPGGVCRAASGVVSN